jgi:DnaJ-domain-containing protein 1
MNKNIDINELARKEKNEYARKWRQANPDKVKKHMDNYWIKKAEEKLEEIQGGK